MSVAKRGSQNSVIDSERRRLKCRHLAFSRGSRKEVVDDKQQGRENCAGRGIERIGETQLTTGAGA